MVHCCVIGCKSRSERKCENITFHTFPKDVTVRKVWLAATGKQNWEPTNCRRICSKHFKGNCFRKTKYKVFLDKFAVPTLSIHNVSICGDQLDESLPSTSTKDHETMECQPKTLDDSARVDTTMTPRKVKLTSELTRKTLLN